LAKSIVTVTKVPGTVLKVISFMSGTASFARDMSWKARRAAAGGAPRTLELISFMSTKGLWSTVMVVSTRSHESEGRVARRLLLRESTGW
jgi:hypothetical protein